MRPLQEPRGDQGAVLVWMALLMVALLGVGALAVDLGYGYAVKRQLSSTSDSAALAGAQEAGLKYLVSGGCTTALQTTARNAAIANYNANHPQGSDGNPTVTMRCYLKDGTPVTPTATANSAAVTRVSVEVRSSSTLGTFLGRVLGVSSLKPAATATAQVSGSQYLLGLRPFLVCLNDAQTARDEFEAIAQANEPNKNPETWIPQPDLYQSFYAKFAQNVEPDAANLVYKGALWDATTDEISKGNENHNLVTGDYVRLANVGAAGTDVSNRFYYVEKVDNKAFKVRIASTGATVDVGSNGPADVYKYTGQQDAAGTWTGDTVTAVNHGLTEDQEVWVQTTSGDNTLDGPYTVDSVPTVSTLRLSNGTSVVSVSTSANVNLYVLTTTSTGSLCNPSSSPANWGYSAFDLSGDNQQLACLIKYGYGGDPSGSGPAPNGSECTDPDDIPGVNVGTEGTGVPAEGDQGNNLGTSDGLLIKALIESEAAILLPVGDGWNSLGGNNAEYTGKGAISVRLCGYALPGNQVDQTDPQLPSAANSYYFDPGCGSSGDYLDAIADGRVTRDTSLAIQWMFKEYTGSFVGQPIDPSQQCPLDSCIGQLQLTN